MIRAYELAGDRLKPVAAEAETVVWWDLFQPTRDEEQQLEKQLGIEVPTKDEMQEIEITSRLYSEDGAHFMTALIPSQTESDDAVVEPITFVLIDHRLVTIRYTEPRSFAAFPVRAEKAGLGLVSGETVLFALFETIVDRLADILERAGHEVDVISRTVFGQKGAETRSDANYKATLEQIGQKGDLTSDIRDSLATLERVFAYLAPKLGGGEEAREQLNALVADVRSLTDHSGFLAQKITFLLDATLGLINIEQNAIIKIFSVAAVVFLPPTLVASIYGMNFHFMPELDWPFGYPFAICLMIASAILPFLYFKSRKWL